MFFVRGLDGANQLGIAGEFSPRSFRGTRSVSPESITPFAQVDEWIPGPSFGRPGMTEEVVTASRPSVTAEVGASEWRTCAVTYWRQGRRFDWPRAFFASKRFNLARRRRISSYRTRRSFLIKGDDGGSLRRLRWGMPQPNAEISRPQHNTEIKLDAAASG
jgi:hypothetical protein